MKMEGCYLFYGNQHGEHVRSGKANRESGNSFRHRLDSDAQNFEHWRQNCEYSTHHIETYVN